MVSFPSTTINRIGLSRMTGARRARFGTAGCESGQRFANWVHGTGVVGRRGAAQECGSHRRKPYGVSEVRANCAMWHGDRQA